MAMLGRADYSALQKQHDPAVLSRTGVSVLGNRGTESLGFPGGSTLRSGLGFSTPDSRGLQHHPASRPIWPNDRSCLDWVVLKTRFRSSRNNHTSRTLEARGAAKESLGRL